MEQGVAGAGAVGCYFGGRLYEAGHEVKFIARGEHLHAMSQQGLAIQEEDRQLLVDGIFTDNVTALADVDLVLFCVKSNDTKEMAEQLKAILKEKALVMTMQNGIENEEILKDVFGADRVLSAVTYIQAAVDAPGKVLQQGRVKLVIGELDPSTDIKSGVVSLLQEAGVDTVPSENILSKKWNKLMWNATFNPLSALYGLQTPAIHSVYSALNFVNQQQGWPSQLKT